MVIDGITIVLARTVLLSLMILIEVAFASKEQAKYLQRVRSKSHYAQRLR